MNTVNIFQKPKTTVLKNLFLKNPLKSNCVLYYVANILVGSFFLQTPLCFQRHKKQLFIA